MTIAFPTEETRATTPSTDQDLPTRPISNSKSQISNSQSTGPRSPEGKSRSSQNARKHNLSATNPPVSLLANPTYQISSKEFTEEFNPQTPAQIILVDQLTFVAWKLDQIPKLEHQILSTPIGETDPTPVDQIAPVDPEAYLFAQLTDPNAPPPPKDTTNHITAAHLLQNSATPLTRLWDYHRRLQARFQSLLRQINQLKRQEQNAQDTHHRAEERQRRKDHDILSQCVEEMHQRNKAKQEADRRQRQEQYEREYVTPSPGTPGEGRGTPSALLHS